MTNYIPNLTSDSQFTLLVMLALFSCAIELMVLVALRANQRASASVRCWLLQLGFLALAIGPLCYLLTPGVGLRRVVVPSLSTAFVAPQPYSFPPTLEFASGSHDKGDVASTVPRRLAPTQAVAKRAWVADWSWQAAIIVVWLAVALLLLIRWTIGHVWQMRVVASSVPVRDARWRHLLAGANRPGTMDVSKVVLRSSKTVQVPMVAGLIHPCVLLPEAAGEWSDDRAILVLRHELSHLERHDLHWQALALLTRCVYWFQPLTWASWRRLKAERECACDDRVLNAAVCATEYATLLHDMADRFCRRHAMSAGIAMAERHQLTERVQRALDPGQVRNPCGARRQISYLIIAMLIAVSISVPRPFAVRLVAGEPTQDRNPEQPEQDPASEAANAVNAQNDGPVKLPDRLSGDVVDVSGNPIAEAAVTVRLMHHHGHDNDFEMVKEWHVSSDVEGRYEIDTSGLPPQPRSAWLTNEARASGFVQTPSGWGYGVARAKGGSLKKLELEVGRMVRGRVVTDTGDPIASAQVKPIGAEVVNEDGPSYWWPSPTQVRADGTFEIGCPKDRAVRFWVFDTSAAPRFVMIDRDTIDLGDIKLPLGAPVAGRLLDRDGRPLADVCVGIQIGHRHEMAEGFRHTSTSIEFATLTDRDGQFDLPHIDSLALLYVVDAARDDRRPDTIRGRTEAPAVVPLVIEAVDGKLGPIVIQEAESIEVRGTVRWKDGLPAEGVQIRTSVMPHSDKWRFGYPWLSIKSSDEHGHYRVTFPRGVEDANVFGFGKKDDAGVWHYAKAAEDGPADRGDIQSMSFLVLSEDVSGADWVLLTREDAFENSNAPPPPKPEARFKPLDDAYRDFDPKRLLTYQWILAEGAAEPEPQTTEARKRLIKRLHEIEAQHSGQELGLQAMVTAIQLDLVRDSEEPFLTAASGAYQRLLADYVRHPMVDLAFAPKVGSIRFLELAERVAAENASHEIQGIAKYQLAYHLFELVEVYAGRTVEALLSERPVRLADGGTPWETDMQERNQFLRGKTFDGMKEQAVALCEELIADYADVTFTSAGQSRQGSVAWYRSSQQHDGPNPTVAELAAGLLNTKTKLLVGRPAIEIDGSTLDGERFKLSDYRGRVVLLLFKPSRLRLPTQNQLAKVREKYTEDQLAILAVDSFQNRYDFKTAHRDGRIVADKVWQEKFWAGKLSLPWGALASCGYVIDADGIIQWTGNLNHGSAEAEMHTLVGASSVIQSLLTR